MAKFVEKCPVCESRNIGEGIWEHYADMRVKGKAFSTSKVLAHVCGDCGAVFNLRVAKPEKFSQREKD